MIPRRSLLAAGPLALAACRSATGAYFGRTDPPQTQRLVVVLGVEPGSLDPATSADLAEEPVLFALFEGLTTLHPRTGAAMAGLATHYELTRDGLRYTFYLRGHPEPKGIRLTSRNDLPVEYSRGLPVTPDSKPARWSDGVPISADDVVYSWRRTVDPSTASAYAYLMSWIVNGEDINSGKLAPDRLDVTAIDQHTLQVRLRARAPFFLELIASKWFCPVPRHVIARSGAAWTRSGQMVSSGAFALRERRSGERITLARNPFYYDSAVVVLDELVFLPIMATAASANLYRTAGAAMTPVTPTLSPLLQDKKDYRPTRVFGVFWAPFKTASPPFNDVRVRYALNLATDKRAIAGIIPGQSPAITLVPPLKGYEPPADLPYTVGPSKVNVLAFNPRAAGELMEAAIGRSRLRVSLTHPPFADLKMIALILQQQWRQTLGIEVELVLKDVSTWIQATFDRSYPGIVLSGDLGPYMDPWYFLEQFTTSVGISGSDWSDPDYDRMIAKAASTGDRSRRLRQLSQCEHHLLRAMPIVPLSASVWPSLAKPYVKGLSSNQLNRQQFKYVWIDTNWRPS